ncbi:pyridoxamine 5'-phosphate oxidase family protein [Phytohabitans sp. ZYX-F-186]|uniref:Pyridoxamine 5'-phosphate oxidase family protein n=1 Tax=Phytohabitans maris TaxID=3071409 RepID=A0ABU0ZG34_9ACTN|nr:pyridoxamine 5'-phosphate oxidase family protein [Phytohabitans sp. ZYX-F-186]MDQ7905297.1 pyridoxamine 5'-phosphate oxidase family protein [Phytohabitans sp. ZYX-F-186]
MTIEVAPPRSGADRKRDTLTRLENDLDVWVSTASPNGAPYLLPLSFIWIGGGLLLATPERSVTGRNLRASGVAHLALGQTRDLVLVEGTVTAYTREEVPADLAEAFARQHWDARESKPPYGYFLVTPRRVRAWREENELAGREIMRDGRWLV